MSRFSDYQRRPIWRRAWDRLVNKYNWTFRKQQYVYLFDPSTSSPPSPGNLKIQSFDHRAGLSREVADAISTHLGPSALEGDLAEMRAGGVFWAGFLDGEVVGAAMTLRGGAFVRWLLPLAPKDQVIFRFKTLPPYRGRGIGACLFRSIALEAAEQGGKVYADCRVFNTPSIRTMERAGFWRVATVRSLTREEALGAAA